MYTADEMDTALDTALEMDTVGHELILAWVERGQPTSERGGCERVECEIVREAFLSHPLFIDGNMARSIFCLFFTRSSARLHFETVVVQYVQLCTLVVVQCVNPGKLLLFYFAQRAQCHMMPNKAI